VVACDNASEEDGFVAKVVTGQNREGLLVRSGTLDLPGGQNGWMRCGVTGSWCGTQVEPELWPIMKCYWD
jgi:hypothetical protein